jgi:hypothetical protein
VFPTADAGTANTLAIDNAVNTNNFRDLRMPDPVLLAGMFVVLFAAALLRVALNRTSPRRSSVDSLPKPLRL